MKIIEQKFEEVKEYFEKEYGLSANKYNNKFVFYNRNNIFLTFIEISYIEDKWKILFIEPLYCTKENLSVLNDFLDVLQVETKNLLNNLENINDRLFYIDMINYWSDEDRNNYKELTELKHNIIDYLQSIGVIEYPKNR